MNNEFKIWISGAVEYSSSSNVFLITRIVLHHCTKFIFILAKLGTITRRSVNFFFEVFFNFYMCQIFSISGEKYNITTLREMMCRLLSKQRCAKDSLLPFKPQEALQNNSTR